MFDVVVDNIVNGRAEKLGDNAQMRAVGALDGEVVQQLRDVLGCIAGPQRVEFGYLAPVICNIRSAYFERYPFIVARFGG